MQQTTLTVDFKRLITIKYFFERLKTICIYFRHLEYRAKLSDFSFNNSKIGLITSFRVSAKPQNY
jgi:hypothetical protein